MCFNATVTTPLDVAQEIYDLKVLEELNYSQYNENRIAFTHPFLPIISEGKVLSLGKWGLIPSWVKECKKSEEIVKYTLNARVETLTEKPSFKGSVNKGRVVVMFDGFYEWQHRGKEKVPHYISSIDKKPLLMAGLVSTWSGIDTFTIVTTEAKGIMKEVHNSKERMPYFLNYSVLEEWLNSKTPYIEVIKDLTPEYEHLQAIERSPN